MFSRQDDTEDADNESNQLTQKKLDSLLHIFKKDAAELAVSHIRRFFKGRQLYCGGSIPESVLLSPAYVKMVLNMPLADGVERCYELLGGDDPTLEEDNEEEMPKDVAMVLGLQKECAKMLVPKCFSGGIMLIFFEQCKGMTMPVGVGKNM